MNRRHRLTSSSDFKRVRRTGRSYAHPLAILAACPNDREHVRVGITAGRAMGGAVQRNRAKRLLREALRRNLNRIRPGWDIVLIARPELRSASWPQIEHALLDLLARAGLRLDNGLDNGDQ